MQNELLRGTRTDELAERVAAVQGGLDADGHFQRLQDVLQMSGKQGHRVAAETEQEVLVENIRPERRLAQI